MSKPDNHSSAGSAEPVGYFCFVPAPPDDGEPLRIRAWTTDAERAKSLGEIIGRKMEPLYRAPAQAVPVAWRWRTSPAHYWALTEIYPGDDVTDVQPLYASQPSPAATVETKPFSAKENLREVVAQVQADIEAAQLRCSAATGGVYGAKSLPPGVSIASANKAIEFLEWLSGYIGHGPAVQINSEQMEYIRSKVHPLVHELDGRTLNEPQGAGK